MDGVRSDSGGGARAEAGGATRSADAHPPPTGDGLRAPGEVLLVSCYELGHPPMGIAWPAAFLERAGFRPASLDLSVESLDPARIERARLVVISVPMHTALRLGIAVARRVRAMNPAARIVFHGHYAILHAALLLERERADAVLGGEAEEDLVSLALDLDRDRGRAPMASPPPALRRLDFPVPSRSGLGDMRRYAHLEIGEETRPAGYVEASRGCLHACRHCPIPPVYGGRFFAVPREVVIEDVRRQAAAGARHITFGDPDFLNGPTHSLRIAEAVHGEFPDLTFDVTAKVEHVVRHREAVARLGGLGCIFLVTAVESLNETVLANLAKGHTASDARLALEILRRAGIVMRPTFVPFTPWETLESYAALLDWLGAEDLPGSVDPVQLTIRLLVPAGSLLADSEAMRPFLRPGDPEELGSAWSHPDPRMDALQADLARIVERCAAEGAAPEAAHAAIRARTRAARGVDSKSRGRTEAGAAAPAPSAAAAARIEAAARKPRLTEPWFC